MVYGGHALPPLLDTPLSLPCSSLPWQVGNPQSVLCFQNVTSDALDRWDQTECDLSCSPTFWTVVYFIRLYSTFSFSLLCSAPWCEHSTV